MTKLKKGDKVVVLSGRDKGRTGTIERIYPKRGTAIVPSINMVKKHIKKSVAADGKGGIYDIPKEISLAKLALAGTKDKPVKIGFAIKKGKKVRVNKKTGKTI